MGLGVFCVFYLNYFFIINCVRLVFYILLTSIDKDVTSYVCGEHVYSFILPVKVGARKIQNPSTVLE